MNLSLGIVGLPNVGKSTLFNALTKQQIPAENYPFCTIDPNVGIVAVADPRLDALERIEQPDKKTPAVIEFWDIAGLVKGASSGAGLGNKFLANIRSVSAIVHVVRAFENTNITHVEEKIDPLHDIELINSELILKDIETVDAKLRSFGGKARADKDFAPQENLLKTLLDHLNDGKLALTYELDTSKDTVVELYSSLFLLTSKPVIYVLNCKESEIEEKVSMITPYLPPNAIAIGMDIKMEAELASLDDLEREEYMKELSITEPALNKLTREAYSLLGLISFFTSGKQEVRAWTITRGTKAPQAAGVIHTDFEKHFITAEVVKFDDFVSCNGWLGSKDNGKVRLGGKDYIMQDGDVVLFRHNA